MRKKTLRHYTENTRKCVHLPALWSVQCFQARSVRPRKRKPNQSDLLKKSADWLVHIQTLDFLCFSQTRFNWPVFSWSGRLGLLSLDMRVMFLLTDLSNNRPIDLPTDWLIDNNERQAIGHIPCKCTVPSAHLDRVFKLWKSITFRFRDQSHLSGTVSRIRKFRILFFFFLSDPSSNIRKCRYKGTLIWLAF